MKKINYTYYLFIYIITIGIVFTHCKKEEIQLIQTKIMVGDSAVYFSNDAGKTFIKALYVNGIHYGNVDQGLYYSTNKGSSWTLSNISQKIDSIWYVANIFIAQGKTGLFGSTNGQQFTSLLIQATIKAVTTNNNLAILFTNKGVFTATNLQNINATNITDSVQANLKINNTLLVGTVKGLYYFNDNNFTLTNLKNSINNIYTSNGLIIASGDSLYFSTNGNNWEKIINLGTIKFANTTDSLYYSNDGVNWMKSGVGRVEVVKSNGSIFVTTSVGKTLYSTNGADWVTQPLLALTKEGQTPNIFGKIYLSINGINWVQLNFDKNVENIVNKNGIIVLSTTDGIYYSDNILNWVKTNINQPATIQFLNNKWFAINEAGVYVSTNGKDWQITNLSSKGNSDPNTYRTSIVERGGVFYGVLPDDYIDNFFFEFVFNNGRVFYSLDGLNWTRASISNPFKVEYLSGIWVATSCSYGATNVYYSNDGINWVKSITEDYLSSSWLANFFQISLKIINNTFLISIVTKYNQIITQDSGLVELKYFGNTYYSSNGSNFKRTNLNKINLGSYYKNGIYLVGATDTVIIKNTQYVKNTHIYYSSDGINYIKSNLSFRVGVVNFDFIENMFICSNPFSNSYISADGKNWQEAPAGFGSSNGIIYYRNIWIKPPSVNGIYYSLDGTNWQPTNLNKNVVKIIKYE